MKRLEEFAASLGISVSEDGKTVSRASDGFVFAFYLTSDKLYWRFCCGPKKSRVNVRVHRLQAWQKYGEAIYEPGIVCRHLDNNSFNNHRDNIAIGTQQDNMMDCPPERRRAKSFHASRSVVKYDHAAVVAYYKQAGFAATLAHFGIPSRGTLSFILNKSATAATVPKAERFKKLSASLDGPACPA